jgi:SAM-dependent methyltransferase
VLGDATRLPFRERTFRAVVMSHVLHVVSDAVRALDEVQRLLEPGGIFLHERTRYSETNPWHAAYAVRETLLAELGARARHRPTPSEVERILMARGANLRVVRYAESTIDDVAGGLVRQAKSGVFSWMWSVPDPVRDTFMERYETWCYAHYESRPYNVSHEIEVWTFQ